MKKALMLYNYQIFLNYNILVLSFSCSLLNGKPLAVLYVQKYLHVSIIHVYTNNLIFTLLNYQSSMAICGSLNRFLTCSTGEEKVLCNIVRIPNLTRFGMDSLIYTFV